MKSMRVKNLALATLVFSLSSGAFAAPNSKPATTDIPAPASTTVAGTAFGDKFTAGYAYAKRDPTEGTVFVFFGNGKTGGCDVKTSNETAFVGLNHPAAPGTYAGAPAEAYYTRSSLEPRTFTSFKIDVKTVTASAVLGAIELVSSKGTIAGEFNAAICPETN